MYLANIDKAHDAAGYFRGCGLDCPQTKAPSVRIRGLPGGFSLSVSPCSFGGAETALIRDGDIVYDEALGYKNVRFFKTREKVVEEFRRLESALANGGDADADGDADAEANADADADADGDDDTDGASSTIVSKDNSE